MSFQFPETMPETAAELAKLRADALDAFNEVYGDGAAPSAEDVAEMERIADGIDTIDAAAAELAAADDRQGNAAALAARLFAKSDEDDEDGEQHDDGEAEGKSKADDDDGDEGEGEAEGEGEGKAAEHAATGSRTDFSAAARRGTRRELPEVERGFRLTTSAQNFETGVVDTLRVAQEFGHLAQGRAARVVGQNGRSQTTLAYVDRNVPSEFTIGSEAEAIEVLDRATNESRLPGNSLVAAGGWCAPSETMYSFLPTLQATDLLSLPEITVRRGGIKFPVEPDFATLYDAIGFRQTETQAQAGTEKPCYEIPCADFEEVRLDAQGVCITSGILQDKAWPELTAKYVAEALRAHQHKVSAYRIGEIVAGSTDVGTLTGTQFGAIGAVLNAVELQVQDMRVKHRLPSTQNLEGIAPIWMLAVLRADLAYRQGVLPERVTDADLRAHFAERGANIQFVVDWQNDVIGGATPATAWPETVQLILYPSGTWWSATEPVVNLGIIHDSTLLRQNKQVQMFTEDGVAVGKRGPESRLVTIPVDPNGTVGARYAEAAAAAGE